VLTTVYNTSTTSEEEISVVCQTTARTPYKHKTKQYECDAAERAKYLSDTDGVTALLQWALQGDKKPW